MADRLYLSYWLRQWTDQNMLRAWEKLLRTFPYSRLMQTESTLKITAVSFSEPPIFERGYAPPVATDDVLAAAHDFQHGDSAYQLESAWDLWAYQTDWSLTPTPVALCCFGPNFESDLDDHLRIEFGLEALFLPQAHLPNPLHMAQSNIRSLLKLVHDLDDVLAPERRQLWSESGENFAERIQEALSEAD